MICIDPFIISLTQETNSHFFTLIYSRLIHKHRDENLNYQGPGKRQAPMRESLHFSQIFGIESEMMVASAHRNPDKVREMVINAQPRGYGVIIAAADKAAALPGLVPACRYGRHASSP